LVWESSLQFCEYGVFDHLFLANDPSSAPSPQGAVRCNERFAVIVTGSGPRIVIGQKTARNPAERY
jgi:hypothetical protein